MHPQLTDKRIVCKEFIQALEACHGSWWARFTGKCNTPKHELNMCLRKERLERASRNRVVARERRAQTEARWREFDEL